MALDRSNLNLFGLDLLQIPAFWRQGWREALTWRAFKWLLPAEPVRLLLPDGTTSGWPSAQEAGQAVAVAIVLPEDLLLRKTLTLPALADDDLHQALELALQSVSPFPVERIVWGFRQTPVATGFKVDLALCARDHVSAHIDRLFDVSEAVSPDATDASAEPAASRPRPQTFEVWAPGDEPIVIRGYGEHLRLRRQRRQGWVTIGLAGLCLALALVLLALPVLNERQHVLELTAALEAVSQKVAPVVAEREALGRVNQRLRAVAAFVEGRADPRDVLAQLSAILPDSVYLTRFDLRGRTVTISGLADNAASVNETLGKQAAFREIRTPSAINRDPTTGKEAFTVEFKLVGAGGK